MAADEQRERALWEHIGAQSLRRVHNWQETLRERAASPQASSAARPATGSLPHTPEDLTFVRELLETVASTHDAQAAAWAMREASQDAPQSLTAKDRFTLRAGTVASRGLPWAVMPLARKVLRERMSPLIISTQHPHDALTALARNGIEAHDAAIMPLGLRTHGPDTADQAQQQLIELCAHPDITRIVVNLGRLVPEHPHWAAEHELTRALEQLQPVLHAAAAHGTAVQLHAPTVAWALRIPALAAQLLSNPRCDSVTLAFPVAAELPEAPTHYAELARYAARRVRGGGAPCEVVLGIAGYAAAERITAIQTGLPVAVLQEQNESTAQLLRLITLAVHPTRAAALLPVIASENVYVLAAAIAAAEHAQRSAAQAAAVAPGAPAPGAPAAGPWPAPRLAAQLRHGIAPGLNTLLRADISEVRTLTPVVPPKEFAGVLSTLVPLLAEVAQPQAATAVFQALRDPDIAPETLQLAATAFEDALAAAQEPAPASHRTQRRDREWDPSERDSALFYRAPDDTRSYDTGGLTAAVLGLARGTTGALELSTLVPQRSIPARSGSGFINEPDTDALVTENRDWMRRILAGAAERAATRDTINETIALSLADLDPARAAAHTRAAGERWGAHPHTYRATRLRHLALSTVAARDTLIQALAADTGAPAAELDTAVTEIIDAARYCGQLAEALQRVRGATHTSEALVLVSADALTPFAEQVDAVLAALAAGSAVLWSVPHRFVLSGAALLEEWRASGLPDGVVRIESLARGATLGLLAANPDIDRAVVLGSRAAARELARQRPDLRIEGRFRGRGSMLVTPAADADRAISDIIASAFYAAGSGSRTIRAVVLQGSVARSKRFRAALGDAVRALRPGDTARPAGQDPLSFTLSPLAEPPSAAALRALTELGPGEEWLVQPRRLDDAGLLWTPGIRLGVSPDAPFWEDADGVPVIALQHASTLSDAIALQRQHGSGGVAALHSYDGVETRTWLDTVDSATLHLNRATTAVRIERQPTGGWGDTAMGVPALAGGPNWLLSLGSWQPREGTRSETLHLRGLEPEVRLLIEAAQASLDYAEFDALRRAALADALVWRTEFGVMRDTVGLGIERNVMRYWPATVQLRLAEGGSVAQLLRVLAAALLVRARVSVSTGVVLPPAVAAFVASQQIEVSLERDDAWIERIAVSGVRHSDGTPATRLRLIQGDRVRVAEWMGGLDREALWAEPVTMAGPVELLTLLREQSIAARAYRNGLAVAVAGLDELVRP